MEFGLGKRAGTPVFLAILGVFLGVNAWSCPVQVALVPGAFGEGTSSWFVSQEAYLSELATELREAGCVVKKIGVPPMGTIEERALIIKDQIQRFHQRRQSPGQRIAVVAHSQGGLDLRYALAKLGLRVDSLVTIGTPHRGTPLADWAIEQREKRTFWYHALRLSGYDLDEVSFLQEMTASFLEKHQNQLQVSSSVRQASAAVHCKLGCHSVFRVLRWIAGAPAQFAGDGMVPTKSQQFGEFLGEFDLDHIDSIGTGTASRGERARMNRSIIAYLLR